MHELEAERDSADCCTTEGAWISARHSPTGRLLLEKPHWMFVKWWLRHSDEQWGRHRLTPSWTYRRWPYVCRPRGSDQPSPVRAVCTDVCVCMFLCLCVCIFQCVWTYMPVCMYFPVCVHVWVWVCVRVHDMRVVCVRVHDMQACVCSCACIQQYVLIYEHTSTCAGYERMCASIWGHVCVYTRARGRPCLL